ncbi:MAG: hypothetical protein GPJ07_25700 [Microcystis aeruginosa G13-07]|nr:hypothetical protein [Microcystis aeruginosa G13-07]
MTDCYQLFKTGFSINGWFRFFWEISIDVGVSRETLRNLPGSPTRFDFWMSSPTSQEQAGLFDALLADCHLPTPTIKSNPSTAHHPKTVVVVVVAAVVVVAVSGTAVIENLG